MDGKESAIVTIQEVSLSLFLILTFLSLYLSTDHLLFEGVSLWMCHSKRTFCMDGEVERGNRSAARGLTHIY